MSINEVMSLVKSDLSNDSIMRDGGSGCPIMRGVLLRLYFIADDDVDVVVLGMKLVVLLLLLELKLNCFR